MPKVSIIIATRNAAKYLERAIRSCLNQNFGDYEVIVVDDGSGDNIKPIARLFGNRINVITLMRAASGCGLPSNAGIRASKSPFIVRVDADDYISEHMLYIEYLYLTLNRDMDAVACDYNVIDENENVISRHNCEEEPIACGIMFRKDRLIDVGLYDEALQRDEEKELMSRFVKKHKVYRIPLPLYRYYKHEGSLSSR
uniref:Putative glycosyltransferase n=1 Tax=viral metagenome TaxID=1070528 RepID=A0A6M3XYH4_9ZZZZ